MAKRIFEADIEAPAFVKKGGLASQYLKADGSVSTNNGGTLGANLFPYKIKTTVIGAEPTAGHLCYDNATQINSTSIFCSHLVENDYDVRLFLESFTSGDTLIIQDRDNSSNSQVWQINGKTPDPTFVSYEVSLISSSGTGTTNFANNHEVFMVRQATSVSSEGYIQRQIAYITASRNLLSTDKAKTIIVDNSVANPVLTLLDNTYAISDEVEIYNRNNFNFKITNAGANTGIIYFGEFYDTGDDIILPAFSKTWLKCINSNLFELSSERKPLKTINGINLYGVGNIPIVGGGSTLITTNRQTASYTLALTDANKLVEMNVATANNLTVPPNASVAFPIGTPIDISQYGAGITTIVAGAGVTIRSANNWFKMNAQYAGASLVKIGTNEWYLFGNLNA